MQAFHHTLSDGLSLRIIPDSSVYHDGHPIISYTYSLFIDRKKGAKALITRSTDYINHPDYIGFITIEEPGKLFTYSGYGKQHLTIDQSEEMIGYLMHLRETPSMWPTQL